MDVRRARLEAGCQLADCFDNPDNGICEKEKRTYLMDIEG